MANPDFSGTPEQFQTAYGQVSDAHANIRGILNTLTDNINADIHTAWQGDASTIFQSVMGEFHQKAEKVNAALQHIGDMLQESGKVIASRETEMHAQVKTEIGNALHP